MPLFHLFVRSAACLALASSAAQAVHLDIELRGAGPKIEALFCATQGVGCDLPGALKKLNLPRGKLPVDGESGSPIFVADFGDFPKPFDTANPGFNAPDGALIPNELVAYKALGSLRYWNPDQKQWNAADNDVRIRLFGGLTSNQVVTNPGQCGGLLICVPQDTGLEEGSTVFSASGIEGPETLLINNVSARGGFHDHLDWFLERRNGTKGGPAGAYLVQMRIVSDKRSQGSDPILIAFNSGLSDDAFVEAVAARMAVPAQPTPTPIDPPAPNPLPDNPPPDPGSNPATPVTELPFGRFSFRESASERLASCASGCVEQVRGSASLDARAPMDTSQMASLAQSASSVILRFGTHRYQGSLKTAVPLPAKPASGGLRLAIQSESGAGAGRLDVKWDSRQLSLRGRLSGAGVFAGSYLGRSGGRGALPETVTVDFVQADGTISLRVTATVNLTVNPGPARTVRKKGAAFRLDTVRISGRIR